MGLKPLTLKFPPEYEWSFQHYYSMNFRWQSQIAMSLAPLLVVLFGLGDLSFATPLQKSMLLLRFGIAAPLLIMFTTLIWLRRFRKHVQTILLCGFLTAIIPINILIIMMPPGISDRYTMALLIVITFVFSLSRLQFAYTLPAMALLLPFSIAVVTLKTENPSEAGLYSLYITGGFFVGMVTNYLIEFSIRKSFYYRSREKRSARKLQQLSKEQEKIIEEKTRALTRAFNNLDAAYIETINRLAKIAEYRDPETGEHIRRVSLYVRLIADELGLEPEIAHNYQYASIMHDVGKVGIPDYILFKKGPLAEEEWKIMCGHTEIGARVFENAHSQVLIHARDIALQHHEKWTGGGYPRGLKGSEIALSARIMALADVYDALRCRREYKPELPHDEVVRRIKNGDEKISPEDFDPMIMKIFLDNHEKFDQIYMSHKEKNGSS